MFSREKVQYTGQLQGWVTNSRKYAPGKWSDRYVKFTKYFFPELNHLYSIRQNNCRKVTLENILYLFSSNLVRQ